MKTFLTAAAALAVLAATPALAAPAYTFASAPISFDTQLSLGFTFTANTNFNVTSLGIYDDQGDGFITFHDVGIFAGDGAAGPGALLASTTFATGISGVLGANDFRYQTIAPLALVAGQQYTIAGLFPNIGSNDPWVYGGSAITGFAANPSITIAPNAARYTYFPPGGVLTDPNLHFSDYLVYAVNFDGLAAGGIPEPASWALMLGGFGLVGSAMRRRQRTASVTYA
jgi:PEP-CTERM motif